MLSNILAIMGQSYQCLLNKSKTNFTPQLIVESKIS